MIQMQMDLFTSNHPELSEKQKTSITLMDYANGARKLSDVLESMSRLLESNLLTVGECQMKSDSAIESFINYMNNGGEKY
jgi:selenocysteine lyase/cysteine desulfurase